MTKGEYIIAPPRTKTFRLKSKIHKVVHKVKIEWKQTAMPAHAKVTFSGPVTINEMIQRRKRIAVKVHSGTFLNLPNHLIKTFFIIESCQPFSFQFCNAGIAVTPFRACRLLKHMKRSLG